MSGTSLFTHAAAKDAAPEQEQKRPSAARNAASYDATVVPGLKDCSRFECVIGLYEHERAEVEIGTWPDAVRKLASDHLAEWRAKNPAAKALCCTTAVIEHKGHRQCVMIVHYRRD